MTHQFRTVHQNTSAEIVMTRQEAVDRTIAEQKPHAIWDGALQAFRVFFPAGKADCVDYSAVLNEPTLVKWETFRKVLGGRS